MLARKRMLGAVALANRAARFVWAVLARQDGRGKRLQRIALNMSLVARPTSAYRFRLSKGE
jgi:hypothetical protein